MAKVNQKGFDNLKTIFDDLKKVFVGAEITSEEAIGTLTELQQLPITEDGVTLNFGAVNTTYKKLNTGEIWGSTVDRDDPEITFNVASVNDIVNSYFMNKGNKNTAIVNFGTEQNAENYDAQGWDPGLKAHTCSLWLPAENGEGWIMLPSVKMYGALNGTDDSNTAYFAVTATPNNKEGMSQFYILTKSAS